MDVMRRLVELVKYCHACQMKQTKPRRCMFSAHDPTVRKFNHYLQIDVVTSIDGNFLFVIDSGTSFKIKFFWELECWYHMAAIAEVLG